MIAAMKEFWVDRQDDDPNVELVFEHDHVPSANREVVGRSNMRRNVVASAEESTIPLKLARAMASGKRPELPR